MVAQNSSGSDAISRESVPKNAGSFPKPASELDLTSKSSGFPVYTAGIAAASDGLAGTADISSY